MHSYNCCIHYMYDWGSSWPGFTLTLETNIQPQSREKTALRVWYGRGGQGKQPGLDDFHLFELNPPRLALRTPWGLPSFLRGLVSRHRGNKPRRAMEYQPAFFLPRFTSKGEPRLSNLARGLLSRALRLKQPTTPYHVCIHIPIYIYICVCVFMCSFVRMCVCVYVCMCVCMHACMCVCMCACMYARTYVHMCMCVCMYVSK